MMQNTLVVAGGGAAGFFCAVNAARLNPELKVILVEKSGKLLSKVRVSGGGRCNVTHSCFSISDMVRHYPRGAAMLKKSFHHFFTTDTIAWFSDRGIKLKTEPDGRMFPESNSSQTIIDCLLAEADKYKVEIRLHHEVKSIGRKGEEFQLAFSNGFSLDARFLCLACGGYPKASMFDWVRDTGHLVETPVPSLFSFNMPGHSVTRMPGISVPRVSVTVAGTTLKKEEGPLLVTHWGLSGPAVLKTSAWGARWLHEKEYRFEAVVNWLPGENEQSIVETFREFRRISGPKKIARSQPFPLPARLWDWMLKESGITDPDLHWADLTAPAQQRLIRNLCRQAFPVEGKTTFKEEFVTAGGILLNEIHPQTMESKIMPGLFFAGEMMDVDGVTGGFNFQHAWTSGFLAATAIANR